MLKSSSKSSRKQNNALMPTYLLRTNLDLKDADEASKSFRFLASVHGVRQFISRKNKVVILSHRGRPNGRDKSLSLKPFRKLFENRLKQKVVFLDNSDLDKVRKTIEKSPDGSIFLLENLRFLPGETKNDSKLAKQLASLGDTFINDDFATAHRANASNVGITKFLPHRMGPTLKSEVANLRKAVKNPKHPFILVLGGAKMSDKLGIIRNLLPKLDYVLLGGGPANTFLKAKGANIGKSIYEPSMLKIVKRLAKNKKVIFPSDYMRMNHKILDIGPKTIQKYSKIIKNAKTIIWGGPMGYFENDKFSNGSYKIAKAIAASYALSIVGGGETIKVINHLKLAKKISLISTGGGAMLDFLSGAKMPAIEALNGSL